MKIEDIHKVLPLEGGSDIKTLIYELKRIQVEEESLLLHFLNLAN